MKVITKKNVEEAILYCKLLNSRFKWLYVHNCFPTLLYNLKMKDRWKWNKWVVSHGLSFVQLLSAPFSSDPKSAACCNIRKLLWSKWIVSSQRGLSAINFQLSSLSHRSISSASCKCFLERHLCHRKATLGRSYRGLASVLLHPSWKEYEKQC